MDSYSLEEKSLQTLEGTIHYLHSEVIPKFAINLMIFKHTQTQRLFYTLT